jgi:hypothetical protein
VNGCGGVALGFEFDLWTQQHQQLVKIEYDEATQKTLVDDLLDDLLASYRQNAATTPFQLLTFLKAEYCQGPLLRPVST